MRHGFRRLPPQSSRDEQTCEAGPGEGTEVDGVGGFTAQTAGHQLLVELQCGEHVPLPAGGLQVRPRHRGSLAYVSLSTSNGVGLWY